MMFKKSLARLLISRFALVFGLGLPVLAGAQPLDGGAGHHGKDKAALIARFDKNGDGKLDEAERAAMKAQLASERAARKQEMLAKYDLNKDGKLDENERAQMKKDKIAARFDAMDTNKDGVISRAEFEAAAEAQPRFGHEGKRHARGGHHGHRQGGHHMKAAPETK